MGRRERDMAAEERLVSLIRSLAMVEINSREVINSDVKSENEELPEVEVNREEQVEAHDSCKHVW